MDTRTQTSLSVIALAGLAITAAILVPYVRPMAITNNRAATAPERIANAVEAPLRQG